MEEKKWVLPFSSRESDEQKASKYSCDKDVVDLGAKNLSMTSQNWSSVTTVSGVWETLKMRETRGWLYSGK